MACTSAPSAAFLSMRGRRRGAHRSDRPLAPFGDHVLFEDARRLLEGRRGGVLFDLPLEIFARDARKVVSRWGGPQAALAFVFGRVAARFDAMQCGAGGLARGSRIEGGIGADRVAPLSSGGPVEQRPVLCPLSVTRSASAGKVVSKSSSRPLAGGATRSTNRSVSFLRGIGGCSCGNCRAGGCSWWGVSG